MSAPSILIVHPDRKTQRVVQRILGGTGYRVDAADDLGQATRLLAHLAPILVVVDGGSVASPGVEAFFAAAQGRGAVACMTLLDQSAPPFGGAAGRGSPAGDQSAPPFGGAAGRGSPAGDQSAPPFGGAAGRGSPAGEAAQLQQVQRVLGLGAVTNLLVHPMPVLAEELTVTAQKLIRGDLFGAEKYLLWGTELHATAVTRASQRTHLVGELAEQVRTRGQSARVASMAMLVTDELVSNAVHHAPVDEHGVHYRADLARDRELALDGRHRVELRWGCDGRYLAIEVSDGFGSLERETILEALVQHEVKDGAGAGMGLALTYRSCDHLVFNLAPGRRTQVIALVDVRHPPSERVAASSYNVFVERPCPA